MNNTTAAAGANLEAVATNAFSNISDVKDSQNVNASGYYFEEDLTEIPTLLTELQTVLLACLATLIPLGLALASVFAIRFIWKKYIDTVTEGYEGVLHRDESCESNKNSHLLLPDEIKTSESQFSVIPAEELEEVMTTYSNAQGENSANHTSKSTANGSIITMTMKNNHLIVETEERVLGINETPSSILYSNGDSESVFVVELQNQEMEEEINNLQEVPEILEDETALIHQAEEEDDDEDDADDGQDANSDDEVIMKQGPNTGLSQSDLSASSVGSINRCYSYGNQIEYVYDGRDTKSINHNLVTKISDNKEKVVEASVPKCKILTEQRSQDVLDEDELYLEQQRQLGNGLEDSNDHQREEQQRHQKQQEDQSVQQQQDPQQKLHTITIPDITYTEYDQQKVNV